MIIWLKNQSKARYRTFQLRPPAKESRREEKRSTAEEEKKSKDEETKAVCKRLAAHYECMGNFIRTKVEPTIFYLPARHNSATKRLLAETRGAIQQKVKTLEQQAAAVEKKQTAKALVERFDIEPFPDFSAK